MAKYNLNLQRFADNKKNLPLYGLLGWFGLQLAGFATVWFPKIFTVTLAKSSVTGI